MSTIHTFFAEQHESKTAIMAAVSCKTQKSAEPEDPADDSATGGNYGFLFFHQAQVFKQMEQQA